MTDYKKLVDDLRDIGKTMFALGTTHISMDNVSISLAYDKGWGQTANDAAAAIEELLPKRGKWVETEEKEWGIYPFKKQTCSVCDCKIDHEFMLACMDYFDDRDTVFHYCPNCGAKMEVQE